MTPIEFVLLLLVVLLTVEVLVLKRNYTEKLSDQAMILNSLLDFVGAKSDEDKQLGKYKEKIFDSSQ
ncbi:MAG: hypothetical protein H6Q73_640 [Firmicutes bacterium]|nr:hypothetical protein [Bacillota bacterium]